MCALRPLTPRAPGTHRYLVTFSQWESQEDRFERRDVHVLEVEHLIKSLQAADKDFRFKIYEDAPGGHSFNRLDTKSARESRREIYQFLAKYLSPPEPVR